MRRVCECCGRPMPRPDNSAKLDEGVRRFMAGEKQKDLAQELGLADSSISVEVWRRRQRGELGQRGVRGRGKIPNVNSVFALGMQ